MPRRGLLRFLPASLADGDYDWSIGLFDPTGDGRRVRLRGLDDGTARIRLGWIRLARAGTSLTFVPETNVPAFDPATWSGQHLNNANQVVDFGDARTDGNVWLRRDRDVWVLKTWPRERPFTLELSRQRFPQPVQIQCIGGADAEAAPVPAGSFWRLPLNGAREYRWSAAGPPSPRPGSP
jgi:hypothetical protein